MLNIPNFIINSLATYREELYSRDKRLYNNTTASRENNSNNAKQVKAIAAMLDQFDKENQWEKEEEAAIVALAAQYNIPILRNYNTAINNLHYSYKQNLL